MILPHADGRRFLLLAGCLYVEAPMVERYLRAYDDVDKAALTVSESAKVIERAIKEWK